MSAVVSQLHDLAHIVHSATPPFEDLFATASLDFKLANKTLVKWPRKKQLGAGVTALDHAIKGAAQTHTEWGLAGTLRDSAPLAEQMKQVDSIYLKARSHASSPPGESPRQPEGRGEACKAGCADPGPQGVATVDSREAFGEGEVGCFVLCHTCLVVTSSCWVFRSVFSFRRASMLLGVSLSVHFP